MDVQQTLRRAFEHHQAGQLAQAESLYRKVLDKQPRNADALHLLGVAALQSRRFDHAVELIQKAIALSPIAVEYHVNLGAALDGSNRLEESAAAFERAVQLKPDLAETHANLGKILRRLGKYSEAVAACRKAIQLRPNYLKAHINLGGTLLEMKAWDGAAEAFARLIAINPDMVEAFVGLAASLDAKGDKTHAIQSYQRAAELDPNSVEVQSQLAELFRQQREWDKSIECRRRIVSLRPDSADAHFDLGVILRTARRPEEARESFRKVVSLRPDDTLALHNLGNTFRDTGQITEAIDCWENVLKQKPSALNADSNRVYNLLFDPRQTAESIFRETRDWGARHAAPLINVNQSYPNDRDPSRRLKIGYVSPYFRSHCSTLFMMPLLCNHSRANVEVFCYSSGEEPDKLTPRFRQQADQWRDISGVNDDDAAEMIRRDRIDILVDIAQHMGHNRLLLFARKPAPIQVAWLGYPGTVGLQTIDYRLTDPYLDPPGESDQFYVETSIRLPDTFWCYDPTALYGTDIPDPGSLPANANGFITFGCLNNFCKINDLVLDLWGTTLAAVPNARLILLAPDGERRQWVLERLAKHSVAAERIEFTPFLSPRDYMLAYQRIDLGLDTLPYNGHTTSLDSLYMGVPVITQVGKTVVGRAGWSQLSNLKLTELAAQNDDEFVKIAIEWSNNLQRLAEIRKTLRQRMQTSPLMDAPRFSAGMEAAFRTMWQKWCMKK